MRGRLLLVAVVVAAVMPSCTPDPSHDNEVSALGGEANGVSPGPLHRPGQPCLVCHGGDGPAKAQFAVAGTVYKSLADTTPLAGAVVQVFDVNGVPGHATTNSAGNFFISSGAWPAYPLHGINVSYLGATADMTATVGRDGSCATCHFEGTGDAGRSATTPGHVYLVQDPSTFPTSSGTGGTP